LVGRFSVALGRSGARLSGSVGIPPVDESLPLTGSFIMAQKTYLPSLILFLSPEAFVVDGVEYRIKLRQSVADDGTIGRPLRELVAKSADGGREYNKTCWEPEEDEFTILAGLAEDIEIAKIMAKEPTKYGGQQPTPKTAKANGNKAAAIREAALAKSAGMKARLAALGQNVFPTFPTEPKPAEQVATPTPTVPDLKVKKGRGGK